MKEESRWMKFEMWFELKAVERARRWKSNGWKSGHACTISGGVGGIGWCIHQLSHGQEKPRNITALFVHLLAALAIAASVYYNSPGHCWSSSNGTKLIHRKRWGWSLTFFSCFGGVHPSIPSCSWRCLCLFPTACRDHTACAVHTACAAFSCASLLAMLAGGVVLILHTAVPIWNNKQ